MALYKFYSSSSSSCLPFSGFASGSLNLTPTSRLFKFSTACLAISVIASIFGVDTSSSLADVTAVGRTSVSAVGCSSTFAFLSFRVAVVGFLAFSAVDFTGFF